MEVYNKIRPSEVILPDTSVKTIHEVLWSMYSFQGYTHLYVVCNGHARVRDLSGGTHVLRGLY